MKQKSKLSDKHILGCGVLMIAISVIILSSISFTEWSEQRLTVHMILKVLIGSIIMIASVIALRTSGNEKENIEIIFCSNCGTLIELEAKFCTHCGKQI